MKNHLYKDMDIEELKKDRKEQWMKKNSFKSQLLSHQIMPLRPDLGFFVTVNQIDISKDFFEEEYNQIVNAYFSVMKKMDEYNKLNKNLKL